MAEYRFFEPGTVPHVSTQAFHADRERAPHLEQQMHNGRLSRVAYLVRSLAPNSVVDLGCGDGGLLSLLGGIEAWGYDFQPSNIAGWIERGVTAELRDVLYPGADIRWGEIAVMTETLEHIGDPHGVVEWVAKHCRYIVASSPHSETPEHHAAEHAWGWDMPGYAAMFSPHCEVMKHDPLGWCQILVGRSRYI
jgi:2-polyprenyl-3-methyl-5-hydroxy-6-metoxy-1,4-benzoquinol methylase